MITFADQPLLIDSIDGTLTDFIERFLPLADLSLWGVEPESYRTYQHSGRSDRPGINVGLPRLNFPPRWRVRINSLYWPSGATRWSQFVGITTGQSLNKILDKVEPSGESSAAVPAQLILSDQNFNGTPADNSFVMDFNNSVCLSTEMYVLAPRQINAASPGSDSLWLLPLVDERYYWQWRAADIDGMAFNVPPEDSTQWGALLDHIGSNVDNGGINRSDVDTNFKGPDAIQWFRRWTMGTFLEAGSSVVGHRVVRGVDRIVASSSYTDSQSTYQTNTGNDTPWGPAQQICGGDTSNMHRHGSQMGSVEVRFAQHPEDALNVGVNGKTVPETIVVPIAQIPDAGNACSNGVKRYFSTAHTTSNDNATNLAKAIAKAYYGWHQTSFDYVYAGIKAWDQTGFDDAVEWRMDYDPHAKDPATGKVGQYAFFTRVQSLPPNVGFSDFPQVIDWEPQTVIAVQLTEQLTNLGQAKATILDTSAYNDEMQQFSWSSSANNVVPVWDGMGLCDPIAVGTIGFAIAVRSGKPAPYNDIAYFMIAVKCACTSS